MQRDGWSETAAARGERVVDGFPGEVGRGCLSSLGGPQRTSRLGISESDHEDKEQSLTLGRVSRRPDTGPRPIGFQSRAGPGAGGVVGEGAQSGNDPKRRRNAALVRTRTAVYKCFYVWYLHVRSFRGLLGGDTPSRISCRIAPHSLHDTPIPVSAAYPSRSTSQRRGGRQQRSSDESHNGAGRA